MKKNKIIPIVLLVIMALATLAIKKCRSNPTQSKPSTNYPVNTPRNGNRNTTPSASNNNDYQKLDRNSTDLYFTKHARCRMKCRNISQKEVKDILANGTINYNKSNLQDPQGPTYALEGYTNDRQHVRIIFAPKSIHLTVVTVIDLDVEHECSCP